MVENPNKDIKYQVYYNNKLPIATKPEDYGKIIQIIGDTYLISLNSKTFISLSTTIEDNKNINLIKYYKNNRLQYEWKDKIIDHTYFIRELGKSVYYYKNGELILVKTIKSTKPMKHTSIDNFRNE